MTTPPTPTRRIDVERLREFLDSMVHPGLYDVEYNGHRFSWAAALAELEAARAVVALVRDAEVCEWDDIGGLEKALQVRLSDAMESYDRAIAGDTP